MNYLKSWFLTQIATWALIFKRRDVALEYYNKILAFEPADTVTLSRIAFLHSEAGDRDKAIRGFQRVVAIKPQDSSSWFNLGYLQQAAGDHAAALVSFERAAEANAHQDRAWYGRGLSLIALGRLDEAISALKKNIELQPMSPAGHMALARIYFKQGDMDRCEKRMRKLKDFDPQNAAVLEDETGIKIGIERWWKK